MLVVTGLWSAVGSLLVFAITFSGTKDLFELGEGEFAGFLKGL